MSGELTDVFIFQMQVYFPNTALPALETEAQLSGSRPTSVLELHSQSAKGSSATAFTCFE